ncbi:MAG: response regulator [Candidatus Omnitrophota bacterium]|nr:response regulator [Candidatus Omnitrophota bacterium]
MPAPGARMAVSPAFMPPMILGITVDAKDPLKFNFLIDQGDVETQHAASLQDESMKLIKYFLASLTIPEKDLWVNLSPYEGQRIIPQAFGQTEMGRDLLGQDYVLKQITASLIYPESKLGKKFWADVYKKAHEQYGTTNIPVNTFNKVWIVPDEAVVYERNGSAFVVKSHLKVMLEEDYLALSKNICRGDACHRPQEGRIQDSPLQSNVNQLGSQVVREIVLPALEKEVNEGKNFALLRQINNALILATWYKRALKESLLSKFYVDKAKIKGVGYTDSVIPAKAGIQSKGDIEGIYQQYLQAFKKGVYNYIKEEADPYTRQTVPRKYFSGGFEGKDYSMVVKTTRNTRDVPDTFRERIQRARSNNGLMDVAIEAQDAAMTGPSHDRAMTVTLSPIALNGVRQLKKWMEEAVQQIKDARTDWKSQTIQINEYGQRLKQAANVREQYSSFLEGDPFLSKLRWIFMGGGMRLPKQDPNNSDEKDRYIGVLGRDPAGGLVIGVTDNSQYMTSLEVSNTFGAVTSYVSMIDGDQDFFLSEIDKVIDDILIRGQNVIDLLAKVENSQPGTGFETVNVIGIDKNLKSIVISIVDPRLTVVQPDQVAADQAPADSAMTAERKVKSILFVDNDPTTVETNSRLLRLGGYRVDGVTSGQKALNMLLRNSYDLVVTSSLRGAGDIGVEGLANILAANQPTPFIIFSGDIMGDIIPDSVKRAALEVLPREPTSENLLRALRKINGEPEPANVLEKGPTQSPPKGKLLRPKFGKDSAMNAAAKDVGGIDLNPANLNLRIRRDGKGVPLPTGQQDMGQLNNIEGLMPVIIKIVPATYIPALSDVLATVN